MSIAFVLGNGVSRKEVNLPVLQHRGKTYGCNALYRDFEPDVLVATDRPIADHIQDTGYALRRRFHTRKPIAGRGAHVIPTPYYPFSSGPVAVALAAEYRCERIYLIGFDLGPSTENMFNNLYAGTEFYKKEENLQKLKNILSCYSIRNASIGYCQGFNFIAGRLLEILEDEVKL